MLISRQSPQELPGTIAAKGHVNKQLLIDSSEISIHSHSYFVAAKMVKGTSVSIYTFFKFQI